MKTEAAYVPPFPFTEPEVHTLLRQPSALSAQRKGGGISKGGNLGSPLWLRAKGTPAQTIELIKATPHRDCASDFEHNFCHIDKIDAGILTYFKKILVQDYEKSSGRCGAKP